MACEICGHAEEDHFYNEDGTPQGSFYSCIASVSGTEDSKCGCIEYIELELEDKGEN